MVIITFVLGYIFSGFFPLSRRDHDFAPRMFDWEQIKFAAIVAAPAVILHELGHKFVAIALGLSATFFIFWWGLLLGVVLKALSSPLLILAPAYVSFPATATPLQSILIAFAGPGMNLVLYGVSWCVLKYKQRLSRREMIGWAVSKKLNGFLFLFNMIPLPPFDGFHVVEGLFKIF